MSFNRSLVKALLLELLEESRKGLDWSDIGYTTDEEVRLNRNKVSISKFIQPVVLVDPTDDPMSLYASASSAADDPIATFADSFQAHYTLANYTNPVFINLHAKIGTTNQDMTLESPFGTDYQVPSGKKFEITKIVFAMSVAGISVAIGYGDDGVAVGIAEPTNPVYVIGSATVNVESALIAEVANHMYEVKVYARIPASKFPFFATAGTSATKMVHVIGIESDA